MTTPYERMRAIRWGEQMLKALATDPIVPGERRQRAADLALRYPSQQQWSDLLSVPGAGFPSGVAAAIFEAGLLFEVLALSVNLDSANRHLLKCTLRHYPSRDAGWQRVEDFELWHVSEVLAVDADI